MGTRALQTCDFCDFSSPTRQTLVLKHNTKWAFLYLNDNHCLVYRDRGGNLLITDTPIDYCPVCGRNLKNEKTSN